MRISFILLLFVITLSVFMLTLCPTVYVGDSGEMIAAAYSLGIPHPPGYPLFTIIAHLFTLLPLGTIAYRVNLLSAFFGSICIALLFVLFSVILKNIKDKIKPKSYILFFCSLVFAFSFTFWNQSLITKGGLYTLNLLIILSILIFLLEFNNSKNPKILVFLTAIFCGFGLANHNTMAPLTIIFFIYLIGLSFMKDKKSILPNALIFMASLAVITAVLYLYLPLRSLANPAMDWGNPENIPNLIRHITRKQYNVSEPGKRTLSHLIQQIIGYSKAAAKQTNLLYLFFPVGFYFLFKINKMFLSLLTLIFIFTSIGFAYFINFLLNSHDLYIVDPFLIPSYLIISILGTLGLIFIIGKFNMRAVYPAVICFCILSLISALVSNYHRNDKSKNWVAYIYGKNILKTIEPNGILFVAGDNATFITAYMQKVELKREDIKIYDDSGNVFKNIYGQDFHRLEFGDYYRRLNDTQWNIIKTAENPIYCVTGSNIYNVPHAITKSDGMLFRVLKDNKAKFKNFDISLYDTSLFENKTIYKDFLSREVISLFYFAIAEYLFENKDLKTADLYYDKTLQVGADMDTIQNNIGISFIKKGLLDRAIPYCEAAIKINPKFADAYNNLGTIYYKKGLFEESEKSYLKAIEISPRDTYFYNIGALYRQQNRQEDAARVYERALAINPYIPKANYVLGNSYMDKGEIDKAIAAYLEGLKQEPNSYEIYTNLGVAYDKKGAYAEAKNAFYNALKIKNDVAETHYGLACTFFHEKDFQNAIREYNNSLELNPNLSEGWSSLAVVMTQMNDLNGAIHAYENFLKLKPKDIETWNSLGIAYATKGDNTNAVKAWETALKIDPGYQNARLNIQKVK